MALHWTEPNFSNPESPFIPPLEVRTYDLHKKGRLPTPVDKVTGLVDKRALINLVKNTVIPGYDWTSPEVSSQKMTRHHLLWPRSWYEGMEALRGHGSLSSSMSRIAHNWAHDVTYPATPPTKEAAHEFTEARELSDAMRAAARYPAFLAKETLKLHREVYREIQDEDLVVLKQEIEEDKRIDLDYQLEIFSKLFDAAKAGPKEFQIIDYGSFELRNVSDMTRIASKIGKQVIAEASVDKWLLPQEGEKIAA